MRVYFIPFSAGVVLAISAFLPWVIVGGESLQGVPEVPALWIVGLGALAAVLALLSLVTRKNSRHPLLVIGLVALGILFLSWRILPQTAGEHALTMTQALAIVEGRPLGTALETAAGSGIYLGLAASAIIVAFGLTIVIKRAQTPYVVISADDDVD
jgi:FtsH-binding integral membrane protein